MKNATRLLMAAFAVVSTTSATAKCPPLSITLYLSSPGMNYAQIPLDTIWDGGLGWVKTYSPITLAPGDTLMVNYSGLSCFTNNTLNRNGALIQQATVSGMAGLWWKVASPGNYTARSCEDGCETAQFQVMSNATGSGPVALNLSAFLEGAMDDGEMLTDLFTWPVLLPQNEPYSVLGFTQVFGGGEHYHPWYTPWPLFYDHPPVDWLLVELRDANQPSVVVCTKSVLLLNDGRAVDPTTFASVWMDAPPGNYYVAVRHRNHLGAMTATPIPLSATPITVDFRDPALPTWGTNARVLAGNLALLRMGNVRRAAGTQQVKYTGANNDRDPILTRIGGSLPTATATGYFVEDVNLDGVVKYTGTDNDRDPILQSIGGTVPTGTVTEQVP